MTLGFCQCYGDLLFILLGASVGVLFAAHDVAIRGSGSSREDVHIVTFQTLASGYPIVLLFSIAFWGFKPISPQSIVYYIIAGVANFSLGRSSLYIAIRSIGASGASVLLTMSIVIGILLGALVGEEITPSQLAGSALIFVSSIIVAWGRGFRRDPKGVLSGLIASSGLALAIFFSRVGNTSGGDPFAGVLIAYSVGLASELLLSGSRIDHRRIAYRGDKAVTVAGILASLGQTARYYALTQLGASVVTPLQNIRPVVATILTRALSKRTMENPGYRDYIAAVIAFAGVIMISL